MAQTANEQANVAERAEREVEVWVERQLATAPPLTEAQVAAISHLVNGGGCE